METALNLPSLIASRYIPVRLLGKGGMGAVYEVEHARTGEHLALKVLLSGLGSSPQAVERFKREARASARIKSEHVVRVTDADVAPELQGAPFLVMELLEGMDLEQAAAAYPPAPATVVAWLRQVAQAIDKAHGLGIIHRDLKPENLFLAQAEGSRSVIKVLDFGIAKMIEEGTGVTGAGQMLGTPKYMSPEQATPNAPITSATDRCALGLIAYRLLVGESYYQGGAMGILGQILHGELQPPSARGAHLGSAFDAWFLRACHRDHEQRFATAAEQVEALAEALGLSRLGAGATLPDAATSTTTTAPIHASARRPVAVAGWLAAGLAALSLAGLFVYRGAGGKGAGAIPAAAVRQQPESLRETAKPLETPPPKAEGAGAVVEAPVLPSTNHEEAGRPRRRRVPGARPGVDTVASPPREEVAPIDPYADQR